MLTLASAPACPAFGRITTLSLSLGLFDVFTYMVPGSLYLSILLFLTDSRHLIHFQSFVGVPSIVLIVGLLIASYLLGWASEPLAEALTRAVQFRAASNDELARKAFAESTPGAVGRPFAQADIYLLLAAAEIHAQDAATEISRLRATGLMLRNCSVPFLAACALAVFEATTGHDTPVSATAAVLFAAAAISVLRAGRRVRRWAISKTLQICYWIPEIDEAIRQGISGRVPRQRRRGATHRST
jgi:hypothetical protein